MKSEPTMAEKLAELHNQKLLRHPQPKTGEAQTYHSTALRDLGLEKSNVGIRSATVTGTDPTTSYGPPLLASTFGTGSSIRD